MYGHLTIDDMQQAATWALEMAAGQVASVDLNEAFSATIQALVLSGYKVEITPNPDREWDESPVTACAVKHVDAEAANVTVEEKTVDDVLDAEITRVTIEELGAASGRLLTADDLGKAAQGDLHKPSRGRSADFHAHAPFHVKEPPTARHKR